ncbi:hypothetical protein, partial [Caballeronia sp. AAUFL_F1_KS47]|uniref:hypothetical protein n=1 Tax=Caballeronia sp. AAUFL_F1_KS47 TaxID=2921771 RepID=UPI00202964C8
PIVSSLGALNVTLTAGLTSGGVVLVSSPITTNGGNVAITAGRTTAGQGGAISVGTITTNGGAISLTNLASSTLSSYGVMAGLLNSTSTGLGGA